MLTSQICYIPDGLPMASCEVRIYQDSKTEGPFNDWLNDLIHPNKKQNLRAAAFVQDQLRRLATYGHELRRPASAPLEYGIHELRSRVGRVNFRVLYFFAGPGVAVIALGCTKETEVDRTDISRAVRYRRKYVRDPKAHTYSPPVSH